jgi:CDP-paratose 2-epimerase
VESRHEGWRPGDQLYFVADTRRLTDAVRWRARVGWREGIADLAAWVTGEVGVASAGDTSQKRRVHA